LIAESLRSADGVKVERPEPQARTNDLEAVEHRGTMWGVKNAGWSRTVAEITYWSRRSTGRDISTFFGLS
jgi:hypothetical protein